MGIFNNLAQYNLYRDAMTGRTPVARRGVSWGKDNNKSSRSWELVKEFRGKSHKEGGIDIEIGDGYVRSLKGKQIETEDIAKNGRIWKSIGATAYGIGEGLLDTITLGATDQLTDAGYNALQKAAKNTESEKREQNSLRGYGTAGGAIGGAFLTGGATTGSAIQQGAKGIGAGVSAGSPNSKLAQQVGNLLPLAGNIAGMAMGNAGFKDATGAAASIGKFSGAANKYSKFIPFAAQGLGMIGGGEKASDMPEINQQNLIGGNYNSIMQTMQMLNMMRGVLPQVAGFGSQTVSTGANTQQGMDSAAQMQNITGYSNPLSQFQFVNDLKKYGINK